VNDGPDRDVPQRERIARPDVGPRAGLNCVADLYAVGHQDVPLLAVRVVEQSDARITVRVVLDVCNARGHPVLVAPKVDHSVLDLVAATLMARGDAAVVIAPGLFWARLE
jgi:hypothetical protein